MAAAGAIVGSRPGGSNTMPMVTLSLAEARLADAARAKPTYISREQARRIERSGAERKAPEHTIARDEIVKRANPFSPVGEKGFGLSDGQNRRAEALSAPQDRRCVAQNRRSPAARGARP